jgi:hypothetical protein
VARASAVLDGFGWVLLGLGGILEEGLREGGAQEMGCRDGWRPAREPRELGVIQAQRMLFALRLMNLGLPLCIRSGLFFGPPTLGFPISRSSNSPYALPPPPTNATRSKVNVYDVKDLEKPIQERESALKFMTRSIGMMADGRGALQS